MFAELELYVWIAAEGASPCTGRIDDHPIHLAQGDSHKALLVVVKLHVCYSCSRESTLSLAEGDLTGFVDEDLSLSLEKMREGQGLPAAASAVIKDKLSGFDVGSKCGHLRALVLNLEESALKLLRLQQVDILGRDYFEPKRRVLTLLQPQLDLLLQPLHQLHQIILT